ncbi:hypothetical protein EDD21DRAFT_411492 [Dissophora ornata]|nr:hypothetical protein EDD21DRAFT_411492 [Dissophora ornata]
MDIQIVIKDDVLRGIVTSMLLAIVGGFFFIIVQSSREGITFWLFKYFPKNRGKLYVMATSRGGSYLDVLNLFNLLGGFPMFAVLLLMTIGVLGHAFSGLVVGTKNIPMDLCTKNQCFSTGIGQDLLQGYTNITTIPPTETSEFSSMNNFVLQPMNSTLTTGLPWGGSNTRSIVAANVPLAVYQLPLERLGRSIEYSGIYDSVMVTAFSMGLEYANGTFVYLTPGMTTVYNYSVVGVGGWSMEDFPSLNSTFSDWDTKKFSLTAVTTVGINMLLGSSISSNFGNAQSILEAYGHLTSNDTSNYVTKATYYGVIYHQSWLAATNVTLVSRNQGIVNQLEFSKFTDIRQIKRVDADEVLNATLRNLRGNIGVLLDYGRDLQAAIQDMANGHDSSSTANNGDFLSYITTCFTMAVSQTRPIGMIKGYEQAGVITPVISIKLVLAIPLLLVTIVFLVPYAVVAVKLFMNDGKWLSYKFHVDAREYIINLCYSRFIVSEPRSDGEVLRIIREDHGDDGPTFELEKSSV